jgi:Putative rhamnosyl transferase
MRVSSFRAIQLRPRPYDGAVPADFDHVILTRFSVRFTAEQQPPDEDWLLYRWAFFRDATASSLARQTVSEFQWLVFFDASAPDWLREEVDELSPGLFTPVWLSQAWSHDALREEVMRVATADHLITTRLDSDDAVSTRFVEEVQRRFDRQDLMYINFLRGIQINRSGQVFRYDYPANPFISLVEARETGVGPRTVFQSFRHGDSRRLAPVLNVVTAPRWMQVVHGGNLANGIRGPRVRPGVANAEFDLDLPYRRDVPAPVLVREWLVSCVGMVRTWLTSPHLMRVGITATALRLRGTTLLPRRSPRRA